MVFQYFISRKHLLLKCPVPRLLAPKFVGRSKEQNLLGVHLCFVNLDTREVLDEMPSKQNYKNNIVDIREWKK